MKYLNLIIFILYLSINTTAFCQLSESEWTDPRDNQQYSIVKISNTWWFSQNLNFYTIDSDSYTDTIIKSGSWGRHYSFKEKNIVCPPGWRLPGLKEWQQLDSIIQKSSIYSLMDGIRWNRNTHADNRTGLSLQPSGFKHKRRWSHQYYNASYWFMEPTQPEINWHLHIDGENNMEPFYFHEHEKEVYKRRFTIRCVCEILPK